MTALFSKPKLPPVQEAVPTPVVDQTMVDRQMADTLKRRKGRASTDLTSGGAPESTAGAVGSKQLLGG
jgi:hypothetical protein